MSWPTLWVIRPDVAACAGDMAYLAQASGNAKKKDGVGGTWAQDYYLPAKADRWVFGYPHVISTFSGG